MAVCPVCKNRVAASKCKITSEYKGKKYYFISEDCKKIFNANPERYISAKK